MRLSSSSLLAVAASVFFDAEVHAQPANPTPFQQRVIAAMQGDIRTPEERARDVNRLPPAGQPPPELTVTPTDRMQAIRRGLNRLCAALDAFSKVDPGFWRKECFKYGQKYRSVDQLDLAGLQHAWGWLLAEARKAKLPDPEGHLR